MGGLQLLLFLPEEGKTVVLLLLSPFLPELLWVSFFLSSSRGNMSKSDATLAITSKAPVNEEEDLCDRFVSKNKEKEPDGNAHTSIDPLVNLSIHQWIDHLIDLYIDRSNYRSFNQSIHWSIYPLIHPSIQLIHRSIGSPLCNFNCQQINSLIFLYYCFNFFAMFMLLL